MAYSSFSERTAWPSPDAPVVWQHDEHDVLPPEVWDALEAEEYDRLRSLVREHIALLVGHNSEDHGVHDWVLLNEQLAEHAITDALTDGPPTQAPVLREWFAVARQAAPEATLSVNDYDILAGDAPPDEAAFQSHFTAPEERINAAEQLARLDRFASLTDANLAVSELDTVGFDSEQQAGAFLYRLLKLTYSHPATTGFRLWGYWDDQHWAGNAPLFRSDWSKKPGYQAYTDLLFDQWFTDVEGSTGETGKFRTSADLGKYLLRVRVGGETHEERRTVLEPGDTRLRVDL